MEGKKYHAFWRGAALLTAAGLITKILSAFYRIPYQNIAGDVAFYTYQQVYPIYGLCLVFAVYGFPAVISELVAEQANERRRKEIVFVSFWFLMLLCFVVFFALFLGAHTIARLMGDEQLYNIVQVAAYCFLPLPFLAVIRGYFQGLHNMLPTAASQVTEQVLRVTVIVVSSFYFVKHGFNAYLIGGGAMLGSAVGGAASVLVLYLYVRKQLKELLVRRWREIAGKRKIMAAVLWRGIVICISQLVLICMQVVDSVTFYNFLLETGELPEKAKQLKGIYDRGIPLMQLGTVVATSFSLALIPMLAKVRRKSSPQAVQLNIQLALKITAVIGLGASFGLIGIIEPTNRMLFTNDAGSDILAILGSSVIWSALAITSAAILQGLGYSFVPALATILGMLVKYGGNVLLIPHFGAKGAAFATAVALLSIAMINMICIQHVSKDAIVSGAVWLRLLVSCIAMLLVLFGYTFIWEQLLPQAGRLLSAAEAMFGVALGGGTYVFCIVMFRVFTVNQLKAMFHDKKAHF